MKNIEEALDIFMLAYRLGEVKDMKNLLNSDMRKVGRTHIDNYYKNKEKQNEKNNTSNTNDSINGGCRRLNHLQSGKQVLIER